MQGHIQNQSFTFFTSMKYKFKKKWWFAAVKNATGSSKRYSQIAITEDDSFLQFKWSTFDSSRINWIFFKKNNCNFFE